MQLDGRTLLFSTSVTLVILAVILWSMKRSIKQAALGLGHFAFANLCLTAACLLLSLRDVVPDWASLLLGNTLMVGAAAQYLIATRQFDGRPVWPWLFWALPGTAFVFLAVFVYAIDSPIARVVGIMSLLMAVLGAGGVSMLRVPKRSLPRLLCATSFLLVAAASALRLLSVLFGTIAQASLHGGSASSIVMFIAVCVVSQTSAVGFILMINERIRDRLAHSATHDALTGLLSRGAFMELAKRELLRGQRTGASFGLMLADMDHFKKINDTHGHQAGDKALEAFAAVATDTLRRSDMVGRYGGEEFIGLLPDAGPEQSAMVAERVRKALAAQALRSDKGPIDLTCSIGIADSATYGCDLTQLIAAADRAMYAAKARGAQPGAAGLGARRLRRAARRSAAQRTGGQPVRTQARSGAGARRSARRRGGSSPQPEAAGWLERLSDGWGFDRRASNIHPENPMKTCLATWARGKDFFDVKRHPRAVFKGSLQSPVGGVPSQLVGEQTLTVHSLKCIQHPMLKRNYCGADATGSFNRDDFGLGGGQGLWLQDASLLNPARSPWTWCDSPSVPTTTTRNSSGQDSMARRTAWPRRQQRLAVGKGNCSTLTAIGTTVPGQPGWCGHNSGSGEAQPWSMGLSWNTAVSNSSLTNDSAM